MHVDCKINNEIKINKAYKMYRDHHRCNFRRANLYNTSVFPHRLSDTVNFMHAEPPLPELWSLNNTNYAVHFVLALSVRCVSFIFVGSIATLNRQQKVRTPCMKFDDKTFRIRRKNCFRWISVGFTKKKNNAGKRI